MSTAALLAPLAPPTTPATPTAPRLPPSPPLLPPDLTADDIAIQLRCRRSLAYRHVRAAAVRYLGRSATSRGLLRLPATVWQRYRDEVLYAPAVTAPVAESP